MRPSAQIAVLVVLISLAGCNDPTEAQRQTPKAAAKTLCQAMYDNDKALARKCVVDGSEQDELVDGMTRMTASFRRATDAAQKRYGDEFKRLAGGQLDMTRIDPSQIDNGTETITGDTASIKMTGNKKTTLRLVKVGNGWKVDMVQTFFGGGSTLDAQAKQIMTLMFDALEKAGHQTAKEIESGKYPDGKSAVQGLMNNMQGALSNTASSLKK